MPISRQLGPSRFTLCSGKFIQSGPNHAALIGAFTRCELGEGINLKLNTS
jgi:hypothetical protein